MKRKRKEAEETGVEGESASLLGKDLKVEETKSDGSFSWQDLKGLIAAKDENGLKKIVKSYSEVRIANALEGLSVADCDFFFVAVDLPQAPDIFSYLSDRRKIAIAKALDPKSLSRLMEGMHSDDLTDFVAVLPKGLTDKVLGSADKNKKLTVEDFLSYPKDSTGAIMTSEYVSVGAEMTCKEALEKVRHDGPIAETVRTIFVLDQDERLVGQFALQDLLFENPDVKVKDFMIKDFVSVRVTTDREDMVNVVKEYDVPVLPVVDSKGRMMGIVTFDDAMDVEVKQDTEDAQKSAGVTPTNIPYLQNRVLTISRSYIPWLIVLLVLNTFTGMLISYFDNLLVAIPLFTAFIPAIQDTSGDSGDQTSSVIIRELGLGNITAKDYWRVVWKEFRAALVTALIVAVFNFGWALVELYGNFIDSSSAQNAAFINQLGENVAFPLLAGLVSVTFLICILVGKTFACSMPFAAKALGIDPAVMSGPLIASITDIFALAMYLAISLPVLAGLGISI